MTYKKRTISYEITLQNGSFSDTDNNQTTLKVSDVRSYISLEINGGITGLTADAQIYGLTVDQMARISGSGFKYTASQGAKIKVTVDGNNFFQGQIIWARPDYNQAPDIPLIISAMSNPEDMWKPITDTSISGAANLKDIIAAVGGKVGATVGTCDITQVFQNVALRGGFISQISQLQQMLDPLDIFLDYDNQHISAYKQSAYDTSGNQDILLSKDTGMLGYPTFTEYGIIVNAVYQEGFKINRFVKVDSVVPNASGEYKIVQGSRHSLSSWVDNGPWSSTLMLVHPNVSAQ